MDMETDTQIIPDRLNWLLQYGQAVAIIYLSGFFS